MRSAIPARGEAFFRWIHAWSAGCAKLPLFAGLALVLAARVGATLEALAPPAPVELAVEAPSPDAAIIDTVLTKRAPAFGLTLRRQLGQAIAEEAGRAGYDPLLVLALIDVESDFDEGAVSDKGARGLMQIKPSTLHFLAEKQGLRLSREEVAADPALCVRLGIRYLRNLHDRFGDLDLALMAYNAGPDRIRQAMKEGELDVFRRYPRLVRRDFRRFREGEGLGGDWALAQRELEDAAAAE
ncbi:lytic transglycosylase domain-containing protein [Aggregicoccus sp. 17bor-14]|uniref:lytic transglycosylase domain-containing protein n=1 Tax=Myxococcaceae TaxID=31 RepID=UPI00129C6F04|nr:MULTISPECIES: lytic transglycosylase domain-containing protein [Myxococcaceae]MBF5041170.1 lytic transglycosylase domain-containing protein [Simulacricoccus sp. 17bor-14]MRI86957.1 lytic transglycosylase domain-containing protein [Aggregicoccus sp. 17bor-14]